MIYDGQEFYLNYNLYLSFWFLIFISAIMISFLVALIIDATQNYTIKKLQIKKMQKNIMLEEKKRLNEKKNLIYTLRKNKYGKLEIDSVEVENEE